MSQRNSKATESTKTDANHQTSRRALLTAGAAAVAGAAAAVVAPGTATAHHAAPDVGPGVYEAGISPAHGSKIPTVSYYPNEGLVRVIIRAWQNDQFLEKLLSFDSDADASNTAVTPNYQRSRRRIGRVGQVFIPKPVVITQTQYNNGYVKRDTEEIVLVLPNTPSGVLEGFTGELGDSARALMAAVPFGM